MKEYSILIENRVVEKNMTTAFILEDDVDWDVRVRQSLQRFALASRVLASKRDLFALSPNLKSKVDHRPNTETVDSAFKIIDTENLPKTLASLPLANVYSRTLHGPKGAQTEHDSPYGDPSTWDILWLGHCGAGMPRIPKSRTVGFKYHTPITPTNIIFTQFDETVPIGKYLQAHPFQGGPDALGTAFPPHTRLYHRSTGGELCTVGYAVSQRGARRLLHQFGIKGWNGIFDSEMGRWCAGEDPDMGSNYPRPPPYEKTHPKDRVCLTSQPPIFAHHHPMQGESDIGGLGGGYARKYETKYLRYSVRMNLEKIVHGAGDRDLVDQWPDEEQEVV